MPPCAPPWSARTPDSAHSPSLLAPPWAPAAPEWEEKEKCQDPAAAQRPRSPQRAEGPPLLLQEGDSRPTQASLSPGPPSLQARVFCHPDPWSPAGKPQPRLSPTSVLGLARELSRAPSLSASLYKCASCRAPLGINISLLPPATSPVPASCLWASPRAISLCLELQAQPPHPG